MPFTLLPKSGEGGAREGKCLGGFGLGYGADLKAHGTPGEVSLMSIHIGRLEGLEGPTNGEREWYEVDGAIL